MSRRNKILLAVIVIILVLLAVLFFLLRQPKSAPEETAVPQPEAPTQGQPETEEASKVVPITSQLKALNPAPPPSERAIAYRQIAELFAERYGSYSNQEIYQNLRDLLPLMTDSYRKSTEALLAKSGNVPPADVYEGVFSFLLSSTIVESSADSAAVEVKLQQSKAKGTEQPVVSYRTLRVSMLRVGPEWKVDAAVWRD